MDSVIHLDTHVVVWLYLRDEERLAPAMPQLQGKRLILSPMALLELEYLYEVGKTNTPSRDVFASLNASIGLRLAQAPFAVIVRHAVNQTWTRDPFDRLITATALAEEAPLLTQDRQIREHVPTAVWE